jgi:hypothetical protein
MVRDANPVSYVGPMSEEDYLAVVEHIQQAMAIEPFCPPLIDVVKLLSDWRDLSSEIERLRQAGLQLAADTATESAMKDAEIQRLLVDNAELSAECDQWGKKVADCWREIEQLRAKLADT